MKKSAKQRRREAQKKKAAKLSEKSKTIASSISIKLEDVKDKIEKTTNPNLQEGKEQRAENRRPRRKANRMTLVLAAICSLLFAVAIGIALKDGSLTKVFWSWVAAVIFGVLATGFYVQAYVIQPRETAQKPADSEVKERPFVFIKHIALEEPLSDGKEPAVIFIVANSGPMEAEVRIWDSGSYFEPQNGHGPLPTYSKTDANVFNLAPTAEATGRIRIPNLHLTANEIKQIVEGRANLYFFARGQYKDGLGRTWDFPFCRKYSPTFPGNVINCPAEFRIHEPDVPVTGRPQVFYKWTSAL